ncbi:MAG: hypothetical protein Aurels2KO_13190 [Aureliella sp.]
MRVPNQSPPPQADTGTKDDVEPDSTASRRGVIQAELVAPKSPQTERLAVTADKQEGSSNNQDSENATTQPDIDGNLVNALAAEQRPAPSAIPTTDIPTTEELLAEIKGQIQPVPTSMSYRLTASLVALVMILLPLVYVGLIILVSYGVYSYAIHGTEIFQADSGPRSGRGGTGRLLLYVAPLVVGCVTVLFMIKPLFARPSKRQNLRQIPRETEPKLFEFVDALCEAVHAPKPKRIDIDCDVNASASYGRGLMSIFLPSDLVLTIGLPLVAGLSTRQLAGVLAHEFGHFSQGFGMRISYLIRSISFWFARVVYERDRWDEWLETFSTSLDIRLGIVLYLARIAVWFSRRILWVLMMIGNVVSCALMRQMEYDADLHEIRFSGSKTFESTAKQLRRLGYAMQESFGDQQEFFAKGQLAADMPELVRVNRDDQTDSSVQEILGEIEKENTSWLATHPADKDRIAHAHRANEAGIFTLEQPARILFTHYEKLCAAATRDLFDQVVGKQELKSAKIVPNEQLRAHKELSQAGRRAMDSLLGDAFNVLRPIEISFSAVENPQSAAVQSAMQAKRDDYIQLCKQLDELETEWIKCGNLAFLLDLGIKLKQKDFDVPVSSTDATRGKQEEFRNQLQSVAQQMQAYENLFAQRFTAALARLPQLAGSGNPASQEVYLRAKRLSSGYPAITGVLGDVTRLRNEFAQLAFFFAAVDTSSIDEKQLATIRAKGAEIHQLAKQIRNHFSSTPYPLAHADSQITIARYLIETLPDTQEDLSEICESVNAILEGYARMYFSTLAEICRIIHFCESDHE